MAEQEMGRLIYYHGTLPKRLRVASLKQTYFKKLKILGDFFVGFLE
jgi:hypothetical protein